MSLKSVALISSLSLLLVSHFGQPARAAIQKYDTLFPLYAEACSATELRRTKGKGGGIGGHGVTYIKNLCRDTTVDYPKVRVCNPGEVDLRDENSGIGISVEGDLQNVNWVAVEGKDLFFRGILPTEAPTTASAEEKLAIQTKSLFDTARAAVQQGVVRGIRVKSSVMKDRPADEPEDEFLARSLIGTDIGISMARNLKCVRIPIHEQALPKIVKFLNEGNEKYFLTGTAYKWSALFDNCTHNISHILGSADVGDSIKIRAPWYRELGNLAVPGNVMINLAQLVNDSDLENPLVAFSDPHNRALMAEAGILIPREGAIYEEFNATDLLPDYFRPRQDIFMLQTPLMHRKTSGLRRFAGLTRYNDLETNLRWFLSRYENARAHKHSLSFYKFFGPKPAEWEAFKSFYAGYSQMLDTKIAEIQDKLAKLD